MSGRRNLGNTLDEAVYDKPNTGAPPIEGEEELRPVEDGLEVVGVGVGKTVGVGVGVGGDAGTEVGITEGSGGSPM